MVGTNEALARENPAGFIKMMNGMSDTPVPKNSGAEPKKRTGIQKRPFEMFNPAGFLTGPAEISELDAATETATMEVPDCAWHTCAKQSWLPNPNALPEQGYLLICNGVFEELFDGASGGLEMEFDPHLPETSCGVRMSWRARQGAAS